MAADPRGAVVASSGNDTHIRLWKVCPQHALPRAPPGVGSVGGLVKSLAHETFIGHPAPVHGEVPGGGGKVGRAWQAVTWLYCSSKQTLHIVIWCERGRVGQGQGGVGGEGGGRSGRPGGGGKVEG